MLDHQVHSQFATLHQTKQQQKKVNILHEQIPIMSQRGYVMLKNYKVLYCVILLSGYSYQRACL